MNVLSVTWVSQFKDFNAKILNQQFLACPSHPHQLSALPEPVAIGASKLTHVQNQQQNKINFPSVFSIAQTYVRNAFI